MPKNLSELFTPCALVDRQRLDANIERMRKQVASLGVDLRPHVKTSKSVNIAKLASFGFSGGITVSTLAEAAYFAHAGFRDILYAVGIVPGKLAAVARLLEDGVDLKVILDSAQTARAVAEWSERHGQRIPVLVEIDSDGHRCGLDAESDEVLETAEILAQGAGTDFRGVMTHAGSSYDCTSIEQIEVVAELERDAVVKASNAIRKRGVACEMVSVGSTPTALFARDLQGVTEVRAGVYVFFDLFQVGLKVCQPKDIAMSVLTSVVGQQPRTNQLITDAGALALSKDRSTATQRVDQKYGRVCEAMSGRLIENLIVADVNQEHGLISTIDGSPLPFEAFPVGTLLRILPNHACMTAAGHDRYFILDGAPPRIMDSWDRIGGWKPSRP